MIAPRQMPELGVATDAPAVGGVTQGSMVNSKAPTSGVVALRVTPRISVATPTGVPLLSTGETVGVRSPVDGSVYSGSTLIEFASCVVAVCQSASVILSVPS